MNSKEYFENHYKNDFAHVEGGVLCGATIGEFFKNKMGSKMVSATDFFLCSYELNVLGQVVHAHFKEDFDLWSSATAPRIDCRCAGGHGGAGHPISILEIAERESLRFGDPIIFSLDTMRAYDEFFLTYAEDVIAKYPFKKLSIAKLIESIKNDPDCSSERVMRYFAQKTRRS